MFVALFNQSNHLSTPEEAALISEPAACCLLVVRVAGLHLVVVVAFIARSCTLLHDKSYGSLLTFV
jgi:hypothetical protein